MYDLGLWKITQFTGRLSLCTLHFVIIISMMKYTRNIKGIYRRLRSKYSVMKNTGKQLKIYTVLQYFTLETKKSK